MENVSIYVINKGKLTPLWIPRDMLLELIEDLRTNEETVVITENNQYVIEGILIPSKNSRYSVVLLPNMEEEE